MANNTDRTETYHEVPASRSYYLGDKLGPVNKDFLKFYTPVIFILGVAVTLISEHTNWWLLAATGLMNVAVKAWYVTLPVIGVLAVGIYVKHKQNQKRKLERSRIAARQRKIDELVG